MLINLSVHLNVVQSQYHFKCSKAVFTFLYVLLDLTHFKYWVFVATIFDGPSPVVSLHVTSAHEEIPNSIETRDWNNEVTVNNMKFRRVWSKRILPNDVDCIPLEPFALSFRSHAATWWPFISWQFSTRSESEFDVPKIVWITVTMEYLLVELFRAGETINHPFLPLVICLSVLLPIVLPIIVFTTGLDTQRSLNFVAVRYRYIICEELSYLQRKFLTNYTKSEVEII
jgi:hypothetical protein